MADLQTVPGTAVAFTSYQLKSERDDGEVAMLHGGVLRATHPNHSIVVPAEESHFGYMIRGRAWVAGNGGIFPVSEGWYFSCSGGAIIETAGTDALGFLVSIPQYQSFTITGKIENQGRLRYIDGCTDSLLIPPIKLGDPCLNLLYFPPNTDQTMHTHPSDRIGMILSGEGECETLDDRGLLNSPLVPGMAFCIHAGGRHKFRTTSSAMRVLAFHPDSDFGPTDQDHPMINRTMVDGVSASQLADIHTR